MITERVLPLEGVHNFRDSGGYPVSGGGRLRRGVLWRSGQHHGATDSDLETIAGLGLASVFDLRTTKERQSHPCRRPQGFAATVFFGEDPVRTHAPHLAAAQATRQRTPESTREGLLRNYDAICFRPELQAMVGSYLARLAQGAGPCLVNCMAGKDRTGIAVAMLHLAVGVHRDDVMEDYLLTNSAGDPEARIASGAETIRAITGQLDEAVLRVLMGVEPEYLQAALASIEERHGSVDAYIEEALGLDGTTREKLRAALVEE
ncbi:tyrosine-protein phosphatase [Novosphingobium mangrovi (ex Huang et al. 2023)]|uniref:Tyrosine-protein phosphatase n=1 Tax=Novosphingobium mangrovi (ex Huang et al. 2023) TaxID=2976432 RepID=A0ABT2I586_9SPHN|nr:tyrosine-protein phosphatase [Novosphingobium mangrovi (ex Huang et al. 2023)]MCT2399967.1 tyrosine-protein phosphatase [Novosphingobium mangrovi (ex Huang et al. 2023)]